VTAKSPLPSDQLARLGTALAGRYAIERELGRGGMATVYLADDLKHRRKVAIKVLRPELSEVLGPERFDREIQIVAGLNHPHILQLYDSGEAGQQGSGAATAGIGGRQCCMASRERLEQMFAAIVDPDSVAAIIMELELGEGGFIPAPPEYVTTLAAFARDRGILFIADEIQTGFGRTGKMFASEHYGLVPDLIITAKSLAGGLPLAAVTGRADAMEAPQAGGLGGTYGGNPLACAAALAVLDAMEAEHIPDRAAQMGEHIRSRFCQWAARHPCIGDVRGLGGMIAMELVTDRTTKQPDKAVTGRLMTAALERGVILLSAGTYGNTIRILAPLTIPDSVLHEGLDVVEQALEAVS
jgi:4-aminobutyrate aminotransferase / (S)-3-amino-2-methylpropionate transaminase / 5-aminovalerate transaminase